MNRRDFARTATTAAGVAVVRPEALLGWQGRPVDRVLRYVLPLSRLHIVA